MFALQELPASRRWTSACQAVERFATRQPLRFALLAVLALLAIAFVVLRPSYDTNDDVFMTMIAAGQGFSPAPDEHLVFTNILVGQALKWLYIHAPQIPWYGCYLLAIHYLAQVALLYCALTIDLPSPSRADRRGESSGALKRFALYLLSFALVELVLLNNMQFTTTAFLAAESGIFLLLLAARRCASQPRSAVFGPLVAAVLLMVVAALVRFESLLMALLIAAPLVVLVPWPAIRKALVPLGLATTTAALLVGLAVAYDQAAYAADPQWRDFISYNRLRVKFNDYGWTSYTPRTADVFAAVGWSENDHAMIAHWFFDEPELYSEARLRAVLEAHPWKTERLSAAYLWQNFRSPLRDRSVWAVLAVLPFFFYRVQPGRLGRIAILGSAVVGLLLIGVLTWNNKVPPARVYFPLLSFPLSATLLFAANWAQAKILPVWTGVTARPRWARAALVLLVVGVVMGVYHQGRHSLLVRRDRRALDAFLAELEPSGRELYVCWEAAMPFELISPLDNLSAWARMPLVNLVWTQRGPWQEETKRRFGVSNLAAALCQRDDLVLIATPEHRELFARFAKEHCQADVEFVPTATAGKKLVAGRFRPLASDATTVGQQPSLPPR